MTRSLFRLFVLGCAALASLSAVAANSVLYWNDQFVDATRRSRNPPPLAAIHFATYHVAIFDAVNGITRTHRGWLVNDPAPAGADLDAAVAGAAHTAFVALYANSSNPRVIEKAFEDALAKIPNGPGKDIGLAWGRAVAERVVANRADSGWNRPVPGNYTSNDPGKWRETPPAFRAPILPFWGKVRPYAMTSADQFRAPPPNTYDSAEYARELAEVAQIGARDGADRTEYQTLSTPFWSDDLGSATPAGHWNVIAHDIAEARNLSAAECARLFALINIAGADAGISCWESKFFYSTWRPENGLRETPDADNPHLTKVPDFIPNMASPAFPSYTSGHSTFSAAMSRMIEKFFGADDIKFTVISDGLPGVVRSYDSISAARIEVGMSRVWGGIHVMQDNLVAQRLGMELADFIFATKLQPLP